MKSVQKKLNKQITLLSHPDGAAQAIYQHQIHRLLINENWSLENIDYGNLPVNELREVSADAFYDLLEEIENGVISG